MRMGLKCLYKENGDSVTILRCYGEYGRIVLPESINGKKVTELGDYIFSEDMRHKPEGKIWTENGTSEERCSDENTAACGSRVREICLPSTIKKIGRYAFYNCYSLKKLAMFSTAVDIGAGAFNGCRQIDELTIGVIKGERSCLKEVLAELNESLTVFYRQYEKSGDGELKCTGRAQLLFPVFYEEAVENTPARILETHVHGCGHRYRYAFEGTEFKFREYDSLFIHARAQESPQQAAVLALGRLRYPLELSQEASVMYREYLVQHPVEAAACLLKNDSMDDWRWFVGEFTPCGEKMIKVEHAAAGCLGNEGYAVRAREEYSDIKKPVLGKTGFAKLIEASNQAECTEVTSFLMDASYRAYPPERKRFEL